jgi:hypothetical protein
MCCAAAVNRPHTRLSHDSGAGVGFDALAVPSSRFRGSSSSSVSGIDGIAPPHASDASVISSQQSRGSMHSLGVPTPHSSGRMQPLSPGSARGERFGSAGRLTMPETPGARERHALQRRSHAKDRDRYPGLFSAGGVFATKTDPSVRRQHWGSVALG